MRKRALIFGINGMDGSYISELLLFKGYEVHGIIRRTSEPILEKIKHLEGKIILHRGDSTDGTSINRIIKEVLPDEIYYLSAMSHVKHSYDHPTQTIDVNTLGYVRVLEAVKNEELNCKIYFAGSSEMFGKVQEVPQNENTPFYPRSPYGVSKVAGYYMGKVYREAYGMKIYNGILFNHESERRGTEFLSRKVCKAVGEIFRGEREFLEIGNMEAKRDFGYAKEYVEWIWRIMQHETPDDFVISTGETHSVREWVEEAFKIAGYTISWDGEGVNEVGYDADDEVRVKINPKFYRPAEVDLLIGDSTKSKEVLGFEPKIKFKQLVKIMTEAELK